MLTSEYPIHHAGNVVVLGALNYQLIYSIDTELISLYPSPAVYTCHLTVISIHTQRFSKLFVCSTLARPLLEQQVPPLSPQRCGSTAAGDKDAHMTKRKVYRKRMPFLLEPIEDESSHQMSPPQATFEHRARSFERDGKISTAELLNDGGMPLADSSHEEDYPVNLQDCSIDSIHQNQVAGSDSDAHLLDACSYQSGELCDISLLESLDTPFLSEGSIDPPRFPSVTSPQRETQNSDRMVHSTVLNSRTSDLRVAPRVDMLISGGDSSDDSPMRWCPPGYRPVRLVIWTTPFFTFTPATPEPRSPNPAQVSRSTLSD